MPSLAANAAGLTASRFGASTEVALGCGTQVCRGTLTLRAQPRAAARAATRRAPAGVVLGRSRFALDVGERDGVRVRLNRQGRRLLAARRTLTVTVEVQARTEHGRRTVSSQVKLRAR